MPDPVVSRPVKKPAKSARSQHETVQKRRKHAVSGQKSTEKGPVTTKGNQQHPRPGFLPDTHFTRKLHHIE
jgi:hypothetical protein